MISRDMLALGIDSYVETAETDTVPESLPTRAIRFSARRDDREVGRGFLFIIYNDLHEAPYGFMEDIFVDESQRGGGIGTEIVNDIIRAARELGCYKLIACSRHERPKVHALYEKLGFENHGVCFRMDFPEDADEGDDTDDEDDE